MTALATTGGPDPLTRRADELPDEWWIEAGGILAKFEMATAEEVAQGGTHARAYPIGQWLGGMVSTASIVTGRDQEDVLAELRKRTGREARSHGESYMGIGEIVSRPKPLEPANMDEPPAPPKVGLGDRARANPIELPDLTPEELTAIWQGQPGLGEVSPQ